MASPTEPPRLSRRRVLEGGLALTVIAAVTASVIGLRVHSARDTTAAPPGVATTAALAPGFSNWPMWRQDPSHSGVSPEAILGASNAASLKLHWSAALGTKSYSSPAVVFSGTLNTSLVYVGNQAGQMQAFDAGTGVRVWSYQVPKTPGLSKEIEASPTVVHNTLYFGDGDYHEYALNASTGALVCRSAFSAGGIIPSSAVVANPDASGDVVYFSDSGPNGNTSDGGHEWAMNGVGNTNGQCTLRWSFSGFGNPAGSQSGISGSYATQAYGQLATGEAVVVVGSTDPDDSIYALDALTGARLWRFQTAGGVDADIGAPPTITAPGVNGFADGMVYETAKDGILYALNLRTGAELWEFNIKKVLIKGNPSQSGATIVGNALYEGFGGGVFSLNATTGVLSTTFQRVPSGAVLTSPAVSGAFGDKVIFVGDLAGTFHAISLATGANLFSFAAGGLFFASPAVSTGQVFISGTNGNLYAFGL